MKNSKTYGYQVNSACSVVSLWASHWGNTEYNILYVFYVDPHEYRGEQLRQFDDAAKAKLDAATSFEYVGDVDEYLEAMNAFDANDIERRIDRA